jgi:hypothetical protein
VSEKLPTVDNVFSEQSVQDETPQGHQQRDTEAKHDPHEANIPLIVTGFAILVVCVVLFMAASRWILFEFQLHPAHPASPPTPLALIPRAAPPPRLLDDTPEHYEAVRRVDDAALNGYHWVDRTHGIVHIPIERAKDLLLQRGVPVRPAVPGLPTDPNAREASGAEPMAEQSTGAQRLGVGPTGRGQ